MNREHDNGEDFWGGKSDWTSEYDRPTTQRERFDAEAHWAGQAGSEGQRPVARLRRSLSDLFGLGSQATREHGIIRPGTSSSPDTPTPASGVSADMFDDLDDDDVAYDDTVGWVATAAAVDGTQPDEWDAELAPAPVDARNECRATSIDPLLFRVGAIAVVGALLVPLLLNAGGDDTDRLIGQAAAAETAASTVTLLAPTTVVSTIDATSTQLDPNDLPPAVPAGGSVAETTAATSTSPVTIAAKLAATASASTEATAPTTAAVQNAALDTAAVADEPAARIEPNCAVDYTVVAGDFWIRLAEAAGVDFDELLEANGASASTPLYPGTEICLPAGATAPAPPTTTASTTTVSPTTTNAPTATSAPTTTVATTQPPATSPPGPEDIKQIIRDVWPDELEERALEIAYRESRYVPTAKNFCCYGIFQMYWNVHRSWLADIGITNDQQLYDPATNARAAYALYQRAGGWGPWAL